VQARDDLFATAAYQPEPAAAAAARRFVRDTLRTWQLAGRGDLVDDAVLLTSELVTNAVVHAGTPVQVTCRLAHGAVEVVVLDHHPVQLIPDPHGAPVAAERTSGRGLMLPAELASSWGVTYARTAKAVWFRLGITGDDAAHAGDAGDASGMLTAAGTIADGPAGRPARPSRRAATGAPGSAGLPVWGRRDLGRLGYAELLSHTVEAARAMTAADSAYLLAAAEDGELRVRAAAGGGLAGPAGAAGLAQLTTGTAMAAAGPVRALADAALSLITVPLLAEGRVIGVLAAAAAEPGRFGERDAARLQELADRSAPTLERARLGELDRARQARASFLDEAGEMLAGQLDPQKIVALAVRLVVPALADWCAVLLADAGGLPRPVYLSHVDESRADPLAWLLEYAPPAETGESADVPRGGAAMAGRRWQLTVPPGPAAPADVPSGAEAPAAGAPPGAVPVAGAPPGGAPVAGAPPGAAQLAADGAWCFPLTVAGRTLGLLAVGTVAGGRPDAEVTELADGVARRAALALDNARRPPGQRLASRVLRPVRLPSETPGQTPLADA
jgi:GAF domain-containing protein/anti-sigma regulatory factor (Ser/Thr protein kinase)